MSLFGSINLAGNTLRAQQIGLQVTGQNIANANTPGYLREEVVFEPGPTQRVGRLTLGLGVSVTGVIQKTDHFLEQRLRNALSELSGNEVSEQTYAQLESIFGELSDTDLSSSLNHFFNAISEILNQPESTAARNLAVLKGKTLATDINRLANRVGTLRGELNDRVNDGVDSVNRLLEDVRKLNVQISEVEGGGSNNSDAVGLRDQRQQKLTELARLIEINVVENENGAVSVFTGGEYLVIDAQIRTLAAKLVSDRGLAVYEVRLADTDSLITLGGGELAGLTTSRDDVLGGFLDDLDDFTATFAFEFNKIFSSGQGLNGYAGLTSQAEPTSSTSALDSAGLDFTPLNGAFEVLVFNTQTQLTQTARIRVDLNGLDSDTTLSDLAAQLDAISGLRASLTTDHKLVLESESADQRFAFANDTSGTLAALGINTFFTGADARTLGVNSAIASDPSKFAVSRNGLGADTETAVELAALLDRPLAALAGATLSDSYDRLTSDLTQAASISKSLAEGARVFADNLQGQSLAISGVNIDEEAIKMLKFQRVYQASAKYIQTLDSLLQTLMEL